MLTQGSGAIPTAPTLWEKTVRTVWCIWFLHLSRAEAQSLTPHLVEGVTWEDMWVTMQKPAHPAADFAANDGEGTTNYSAVCSLLACMQTG